MSKTAKARPDWAERISHLRHRLKLSQSALGKQLDSSAMAVSRWERAIQEPPANIYIQLGNMTGDPECWYFWERAGLQSDDVLRVLPSVRSRLRRDRLPEFEIVHAGARATEAASEKKAQLVAIPLLPVVAATHDGKGDSVVKLEQARPESMFAAPAAWCPNPAQTSCLRVRGRSMMPLIHDGYIIVVDTSQNDRQALYGQIVVAAHKERGLVVSRLQRFDGTEILMPENREFESIAISPLSWRVVAKVLWWIGHTE